MLNFHVFLYGRRALDPIIEGQEPPSGFWELNSRSLEEQPVLLSTEPALFNDREHYGTYISYDPLRSKLYL